MLLILSIWLLSGFIGVGIVDHYETKSINCTLTKAFREGRLDTYYISGVPTFWESLLVTLTGLVVFTYSMYVVYNEILSSRGE